MSPLVVESIFVAIQGLINILQSESVAAPVLQQAQDTNQPIPDATHQAVLMHIQSGLDWSKMAWAARLAGQPIPPLPPILQIAAQVASSQATTPASTTTA